MLGFTALLGVGGLASEAEAKPTGPMRFCEAYPESPDCSGRLTTCETCHTSTDPAQWNAYGGALLGALGGRDFDEGIASAMLELEDLDADGDGESNLDEILVGTNPGNAESIWQPVPEVEGANPFYDLGTYDPRVALQRVMVLYCGHSASYEQRQDFAALPAEDQRDALHETLSMCLDGEYWRTLALRELADVRITPSYAVGADSDVNLSLGDGAYQQRLVLADYDWDYRLWRYIMTDDRDIRQLLTAQYHVVDDGAGGLMPVEGILDSPYETVAGGQPLPPEHRAGMITTQWFLMVNTMFSALPRTTAAQAYRSYLGMNISASEGILPVAGEPLDIDAKGVAAPACASCHSTLDPLAYAFSYYNGIGNETNLTGDYDPMRPVTAMPDWEAEQPTSMILGQPIDSVAAWGRVASESLYFRQAMGRMFFEHAIGGPAGPAELYDLAQVVETIPADGHSANRIIHRIIDTEAFGAP